MFVRYTTLILCVALSQSAPYYDDLFELSVIHLNDFHARFEETNINSGPCKGSDCIGGFSRIFTKVHELIQQRKNPIFLNAGDNFQGTLWYNIFKWNVTQHFLNQLPTDAYTLGNHEFDDKISGVVPFIKSLKAPVVVANIDDDLEPDLKGVYQKSTVIERDGRRIGIVGVIAKNTDELSSTEKLIFTDETEAVNKEALRLVKEENCKIIIVLSHCGLDVDKKMAKNVVPHVNLIVGGHSHTLLYNGSPPGPENPAGPYPVVIERENNRKVLIVQASSYSKYLGNLSVWYDHEGSIVDWNGNPIYLDKNVPQDLNVNKDISAWKATIDEYSKRVIGTSNVELSIKNSQSSECNLGDFMADAMVDYYAVRAENNSWTYAAIAVVNSGGIRTSLSKGNITYGDLMTTAPFGSTVDVGELKGQVIKDFLEYSVDESKYDTSFRQFLQFSGMRVVFDLRKPVGSRVTSLEIKCRECLVPQFETFDSNGVYRIIMPSFVAKGGDGYSMIRDNLKNKEVGPVDSEVFEKYIMKMTPVTTGLDGRITFLT